MVNLREIDDRVWLETIMPPVFEKEYEYESLHPFPDTVLAFLLKKEVSAGPTGYPGRNYKFGINFTGFITSRSGQKIIKDYGEKFWPATLFCRCDSLRSSLDAVFQKGNDYYEKLAEWNNNVLTLFDKSNED